MHHDLLFRVEFWEFLFSIDEEFVRDVRQNGCSCGGYLHAANYFRNPRGRPDGLSKEHCLRLSLCCDREGCRKRVTPRSVRFLGRKVYLLPVIFMAAAMRQGPSPRAMRELSGLFGVDRRTIVRWQVLWQEHFPQTRFWKVECAQFALANAATPLPRALQVAYFTTEALRDDWELLLRFLSPITIPEGLAITLPR